MTAMGRLHEPLGQIAGRMVVYEDERADALATLSCILCRLLNSCTGKVPDRFRSILVSPPFNDTVKVRHQVVVESNSNTLHSEFTWLPPSDEECSELDLRRSTPRWLLS
jgi:hypothetical protein